MTALRFLVYLVSHSRPELLPQDARIWGRVQPWLRRYDRRARHTRRTCRRSRGGDCQNCRSTKRHGGPAANAVRWRLGGGLALSSTVGEGLPISRSARTAGVCRRRGSRAMIDRWRAHLPKHIKLLIDFVSFSAKGAPAKWLLCNGSSNMRDVSLDRRSSLASAGPLAERFVVYDVLDRSRRAMRLYPRSN